MSETRLELQPPIAYLPVRLDKSGQVAEVVLARLTDGRLALLGYTALDRFLQHCGDAHPWAVFTTADLSDLRADQPYDVAYLDVPLPADLQITGTSS